MNELEADEVKELAARLLEESNDLGWSEAEFYEKRALGKRSLSIPAQSTKIELSHRALTHADRGHGERQEAGSGCFPLGHRLSKELVGAIQLARRCRC